MPASVSPAASDSHSVCCSRSVRSASRSAWMVSSWLSWLGPAPAEPASVPGKSSSLPTGPRVTLAPPWVKCRPSRPSEGAERASGEPAAYPNRARKLIMGSGGWAGRGADSLNSRLSAATPAERTPWAASESAARVGLRDLSCGEAARARRRGSGRGGVASGGGRWAGESCRCLRRGAPTSGAPWLRGEPRVPSAASLDCEALVGVCCRYGRCQVYGPPLVLSPREGLWAASMRGERRGRLRAKSLRGRARQQRSRSSAAAAVGGRRGSESEAGGVWYHPSAECQGGAPPCRPADPSSASPAATSPSAALPPPVPAAAPPPPHGHDGWGMCGACGREREDHQGRDPPPPPSSPPPAPSPPPVPRAAAPPPSIPPSPPSTAPSALATPSSTGSACAAPAAPAENVSIAAPAAWGGTTVGSAGTPLGI
mmetsp:Transcript_30060/g.95832  ORF Transcript_30060/g.95832 Transcript_30060/m.95832 type:complete len:426 (+) Transcript_30060:1409-2686(+)